MTETPVPDLSPGLTKTALDIHDILKILPHRYPFLLIDRVLDLRRRERIVAIKNVTINEPFFAGHFPNQPIMPGVLIVEAIAQAGGALLLTELEDHSEKLMVFTSIEKAPRTLATSAWPRQRSPASSWTKLASGAQRRTASVLSFHDSSSDRHH